MPTIVLEDVKKNFPAATGDAAPALNGVSLTVADHELLALVGPSGSGKTTLLRIIAGLETPTHGNIRFDQQLVTWQPAASRDVAMVFQSPALFPHLTARENLAFGLKLRRCAAAEISQRVQEMAALLKVQHCLDRPPAKLSGGEKQRIAIGRALIRQPKILLLDEPFAQLDEPLRRQLQVELRTLHDRFATTTIFVSHDQAEALALGERVAVLRKGLLQQVGPPREIYERPANHFVAGFIGSPAMNLIHGAAAQRQGHLVFLGAETGPDEIPPRLILPLGTWRADWFAANLGRPILLGLRPAAVQVITSAAETHPGDLTTATITRTQYTGEACLCGTEVAGRELTASAPASAELRPGQPVAIRFDLAHARVFDAATGAAIF